MIECPMYQRRRAVRADSGDAAEARSWAMEYLKDDVARLQFLKQHHYHPINAETGERMRCMAAKKETKQESAKAIFRAKHGEQSGAWCYVHAKLRRTAWQAKDTRIGSGRCMAHMEMNEWLNCCHPALLAALRDVNVDVQLPYRLPFDCDHCGSSVSKQQRRAIVRAVQRAQDAQTGYCADYCAKNQPMAFHEIKEFQKRHQQLQSKYHQEPLEKLGKRHVTRFLSDAYCKGIVRGQVECCNLRPYKNTASVVATGGRVCLDCSGKAWGWWRCSVCKVRQAACGAFESWLAQHRSCKTKSVATAGSAPFPGEASAKRYSG